MENFKTDLQHLEKKHELLLGQTQMKKLKHGNGIFDRYKNPVLTAQHTPLFWRYDLNPETNPIPDGTIWHQCGIQCRRH